MKFIEAILFLVAGFLGMEIFSWLIHKYVMHGALWQVHKTHHVRAKGFLEKNDLFSLSFGTLAVVLIVLGLPGLDYRFWIGCGISLYGLLYFVLHDVLIHRRVRTSQKPVGRYLDGIAKAHRDHHRSAERDGAVCFGLLWVPLRYFRK